MSGIRFVVDSKGVKTALVIDLKKLGDVWEDFYDTLIVQGSGERASRISGLGKRSPATQRQSQ